jgi:glutaminyl-peptide cyclotransferase
MSGIPTASLASRRARDKVVGPSCLSGLLSSKERSNPEAVLTSIAYHERNDRLFIAGKLWPRLFEIRIRPRAVTP